MHTLTPTLLALLTRNALAYGPGSGSIAAGNLSLTAPWGLDPSKYQSLVSSPDASAAFNITGYNTSSTAPSPQSAQGWTLAARVKHDVSLSATTNSSLDKSQVFEATTLAVGAPPGVAVAEGWRLCAAVYPGTAAAVAADTVVDGGCANVLSEGCLQALGVAATGTGGWLGADGECGAAALPGRCSGDFPSGTGNLSAVAINQTVLDAKSFYAYGSTPTAAGNTTAQDEARLNVWTVVMIYGHLSSGGQLSSTNAAVQCIRAANGTTSDDNTGSGAATRGMSMSTAAAIGAVFVSGWMLMS